MFFATVVEDYLVFLDSLVYRTPDLVILSPQLSHSLTFVASALASVNGKIIRRSVDYVLQLVGHDAMSPNPPPHLPRQAEYNSAIKTAVSQTGFSVVSAMILGLVTDYEDTASCVTAFRLLAERFPSELLQWVPAALQQLPPKSLSANEQQTFLAQFSEAMGNRDLSQARSAFMNLDRMSRKAKRRQWDEGAFTQTAFMYSAHPADPLMSMRRAREKENGHASP